MEPDKANGLKTLVNVDHFICPLTLDFMNDPVTTKWGHTFEREAIEEWISLHENCPLTRKSLTLDELYPCIALKNAIEDLLTNNPELQPNPSILFVSAYSKNVVENKGHIKITDKCKALGVSEVSAAHMRRKYKVRSYATESTYLTFPPPTSFLWMESTGYISLSNLGEASITLVSHRNSSRGSEEGGHFILEPGKHQGFDVRGDGWCIEVRNGDASKLCVFDFNVCGGGKGNKLGMYVPPRINFSA